jgi:hypothetical protein
VGNGSTVRPRRRYLRLSVRALIVLVLVIGGGLGWFVHSVRIQRDAVAAIRKAGGLVWYDWQANAAGKTLPTGRPWAPNWLVDALGVDYFGYVVIVRFYDID